MKSHHNQIISSYHINKFRDLRHSQTISDPFRISWIHTDPIKLFEPPGAPGSPREPLGAPGPPPWHIDRCPVLDWSPPAASLPSGGFSGDVTQKISKTLGCGICSDGTQWQVCSDCSDFSSGSLWRQHGADTWLINLQQGRGSFRTHCYNAAGWTKNIQNLPRCREMSDAGRKRPQRSKSAGEHLPHHMSLTSFQQGQVVFRLTHIFWRYISYLYIYYIYIFFLLRLSDRLVWSCCSGRVE